MLAVPLRPLYQKVLVDPLAARLAPLAACTPLRITFLSLLSGLGVAAALSAGHRPLAAGLLLLSGYLDTLDGTVARLQHRASDRGAVLDALADRVVEVAILLALFAADRAGNGLLILCVLGSIYISMSAFLVISVFTRIRSEKGFADLPSLIERTEFFVFFFLMILLPGWLHPLGWTFAGLVAVTAVQRLCVFLAQPLVPRGAGGLPG
jgi:archaetidylinositol phosphate synthase